MANKKNNAKEQKEKIKKAKEILENNTLNVDKTSNDENNKIETNEASVVDASETSKTDFYEDKKIQDISYKDLKTSFEKGFLYLKSLQRHTEDVMPYKILLMDKTLYNVKDLDLEDEAFYIKGEGNSYIKVLFDDKDFEIKINGI